MQRIPTRLAPQPMDNARRSGTRLEQAFKINGGKKLDGQDLSFLASDQWSKSKNHGDPPPPPKTSIQAQVSMWPLSM